MNHPGRRAKTCLVLCPGGDLVSPTLGPAMLKSFLLSRGYEAEALDLGPMFFKEAPPEIAPLLKQGGETFLRNKRAVAALMMAMSATVDRALQAILAGDPDVVGFTTFHSTWHMSLMLAQRLKEARPDISVVLGGAEAAKFVERGDHRGGGGVELSPVDAIVPGEGELPLLALLAGWNGGGFVPSPGAHVRTGDDFVWLDGVEPIQDLDSLPFPDFGGFVASDYGNTGQLMSYFSRGCFKKCVFCDVESFWKNWRNRSGRKRTSSCTDLGTADTEGGRNFRASLSGLASSS